MGQIPSVLGNLSSLTKLWLARNELSGELPGDLGRLTRLQTIQLSENQLTGTIPASIFNLSSLVFLSLTRNRLSGGLPAGIGFSLSNLQSLFLGMNALGGPIPSSLSNASKIQHLDLTNNSFHGSIPVLGNLNGLTQLSLGVNNLTSTTKENHDMFSSLTNCTHLNYLTLESNALAGELPSSVANLSTDLAHFGVDDNYLTGKFPFPQGMHRYQNLISLTLENNLFQGEIPNSLGLLHSLQRLRVKHNSFSGTIPDVFGNLSRLYMLHMGQNYLSGQIPASLTSSQQLSYLGLDWNRLSGTFPKEASRMTNLKYLNLAHNFIHGALPAEVTTLIGQLIAVDVSGNQLSGTIPTAIGNSMTLSYLSMANNAFTGLIPKSFGDMPALETLDLSGNNLTGPIPAEIGNLQHLRILNLSSNSLQGRIPSEGVFANLTADSLRGNYELCSDAAVVAGKLGLPTCPASGKSGRRHHFLLKIVIPLVCFAVLVFAVVSCVLWTLASKKKKSKMEGGSAYSTTLKGMPRKISYHEIRQATNNFAPENLVGKGGYGCVYKGDFRTEDGAQITTLAVKVLDLQHGGASKSFTAECEALRNVRHRNLVKVFTSCSSVDYRGKEFKALVMEYMANGNLDKWLYPRDVESVPTLNLTQKLNIAIDIASAMDYLHHDCDPPVVHCDLKPGNVLLDDHMTAHIGDFGLSRILLQNSFQKESSTMGVKGSIGYIAPEYGLGSKASTSGDVYSFGILVLEIFTAKKPTSEMFGEGLNLGQFPPSTAHEDHRTSENAADPRLFMDSNVLGTGYPNGDNNSRHGDVSSNRQRRHRECVGAVMRLGLACAVNSAKDRLTMRDALRMLHEIRTSLLRP